MYGTKDKCYVYYLAWGGGLKYGKNGIGSNGPNMFLFIHAIFIILTKLACVPYFCFMELCFHLLLISVHSQTGVSVHIRPVI